MEGVWFTKSYPKKKVKELTPTNAPGEKLASLLKRKLLSIPMLAIGPKKIFGSTVILSFSLNIKSPPNQVYPIPILTLGLTSTFELLEFEEPEELLLLPVGVFTFVNSILVNEIG